MSLGHPFQFQRLSRLGSVTARHSSSERQPNFAALNRGRRLYSTGRPSRWALAHILVASFTDTDTRVLSNVHSSLTCFWGRVFCPYSLAQFSIVGDCGFPLSRDKQLSHDLAQRAAALIGGTQSRDFHYNRMMNYRPSHARRLKIND